jgi:hypothetical protein
MEESKPAPLKRMRHPYCLGAKARLSTPDIKKPDIVTEASRNFADCVNRVHHQNEIFVLLKRELFALVPDNERVCAECDLGGASWQNRPAGGEAHIPANNLRLPRSRLPSSGVRSFVGLGSGFQGAATRRRTLTIRQSQELGRYYFLVFLTICSFTSLPVTSTTYACFPLIAIFVSAFTAISGAWLSLCWPGL